MTTTTIVNKKNYVNSPIYLQAGATSGSLKISIPFMAEYIMVLNDTTATIAVCIGEQSSQTPDAQLWTPGAYISMPLIEETQKLTVFWTSEQAIAADNNLVQFYFSNVTIPLQGGKYGTSASSQNVDVLNTVTVQYATTPNVNIQAMPVITGTDGTNNHQVKTDTNGVLEVNLNQSIPAGSNKIGQVDLSSTSNLVQALTAGAISSSQISMSTTATAIVNGVVNGRRIKIKNADPTNSIFIGSSGVTSTIGYELASKEVFDFEVMPGSTINIYGIAAAGTPTADVLILN